MANKKWEIFHQYYGLRYFEDGTYDGHLGNWTDAGWHWDLNSGDHTFLLYLWRLAHSQVADEFYNDALKHKDDINKILQEEALHEESLKELAYGLAGDNECLHFGECAAFDMIPEELEYSFGTDCDEPSEMVLKAFPWMKTRKASDLECKILAEVLELAVREQLDQDTIQEAFVDNIQKFSWLTDALATKDFEKIYNALRTDAKEHEDQAYAYYEAFDEIWRELISEALSKVLEQDINTGWVGADYERNLREELDLERRSDDIINALELSGKFSEEQVETMRGILEESFGLVPMDLEDYGWPMEAGFFEAYLNWFEEKINEQMEQPEEVVFYVRKTLFPESADHPEQGNLFEGKK